MGTLKGQNLRILTKVNNKFYCVAKATSCTANMSASTDDASTKDDVGMSNKPEVTSKNWQMQVESLSVVDAAAMLIAIKSMQKFTLVFDEVATSDNQTPEYADYCRTGEAYLSDATFNWNDRENSAKSLQFTGVGALRHSAYATDFEEISVDNTYTKGQFVRLFLGSDNTATPSAVIAAAKSLSMHVSLSLEDATTKDTEGDWQVQEPTGISFDISTSALVRSGDTISSAVAGKGLTELETIYEASSPVKFQIANVSGANNRTKGAVIVEGSVVVTALNISAQNKQNATYDATLTGYGAYTVTGEES